MVRDAITAGSVRPLTGAAFSGTYAAVAATPVGLVAIRMAGDALVAIDLAATTPAPVAPASPAAREVLDQLFRYFDEPSWRFDLPLAPEGSAYQQRVWAMLRGIPPGETRTYGGLATALASSARAVGGACRRNPIPIVVPCHRVVASSGPGGFMGATAGAPLAIKRWLLAHEAPPPWPAHA